VKKRITGRVNQGFYEVLNPDGGVLAQTPLDAARQDSKLKAAIARNGWEPTDG
jgi:hypothetical protein